MDRGHSSVSRASQSPIEKQVQSTGTPNPNKVIQRAINTCTHHPASKKPVQSITNPDKAMDTADLNFNHKQSTPSPPIIMMTQVDANLSQSPIDNQVQCNPNVNTCSVLASKQTLDQPHPLKRQLLITQYTQNPNKQSSDGGIKQGNNSSTNTTMTVSENSNKEDNTISQLSSTSDHNKKVPITKGLSSSTDMFTTGDVANTNPKIRKCTTPNKQQQILPKCWEELDSSLQTLLPNIDKVTYVVENHNNREQLSFEGAPKFDFDLVVRINLDNRDQANDFLNKMMKHNFCTYRISRTSKKPALKRVAYKIEMHCQHFRKALTTKQKDTAALAKSKKARKPFTRQVRDKKTQCPSHLTLTGQIPTKKQLKAIDIKPYLKTHTAVLNISFNHNHPIISGHALSFRPVSAETKQTFFELFSNGHSASSARHTHEQHLLMDAATDELKQYALADRDTNPSAQDICRLFQQWREKQYGKDDGKPLFERLQAEVNKYNAKHREQNGRALLQWYETQTDNYSDDINSDGESNPPPPKKRKRESTSKPLVLAICTPLMARAHEHVCQAGELLFCDSTSSMDRFNTSVFVLSTHSVASGIPLGVLLTSDEREETIQTGLQMLKSIFPAGAFYGKGSEAGPDVVMIDDDSAERCNH